MLLGRKPEIARDRTTRHSGTRHSVVMTEGLLLLHECRIENVQETLAGSILIHTEPSSTSTLVSYHVLVVPDHDLVILEVQHTEGSELDRHAARGRREPRSLLPHEGLQHGVVRGLVLRVHRGRALAVTEPRVEMLGVDDPLTPPDEVKVHLEVVHLAFFVLGSAIPAFVFTILVLPSLGVSVSFRIGVPLRTRSPLVAEIYLVGTTVWWFARVRAEVVRRVTLVHVLQKFPILQVQSDQRGRLQRGVTQQNGLLQLTWDADLQ